MFRVLVAVFALAATACWWRKPDPPKASRPGVATTATELFSLEFVPALDITLDAAARRSLVEHPRTYVSATLVHGDQRVPITIKLKGNRTFRTLDDKPGLRIKFADTGWFGLDGLVLDNMVDDPSGLDELLAYQIYRAAGVPAPRAAFARVSIDGVAYGTYLMVEPVDTQLLAGALGAAPTAVFEGEYGCDVFPADTPRIELKSGDATARDDFNALALAADRDPAALFDPARSPLDVPEVVSFLATTTLIGDFDGYWHSHNYFLVLGSADHKWRIVPWGNDRVFHDALPVYGSQGRLAVLCFADRACRAAYSRRLLELADQLDAVVPAPLVRDRAALASALLDGDVKSSDRTKVRVRARTDLAHYLADRPAAVRAALTCLDDGREVDRDGDGYGCMDCADRDPAIHPGAAETCDGADNDCDGLTDDAPACRCTVVQAAGAEFQLCDLPMSWDSARDFCAAKGMTLARLDSAEQSQAVFAKAVDLRYDRWWLGARQADDDSVAWVDGTAFGFALWGDGQPRNNRCEQHCVVLDEADDGTWSLGHCQLYFPFVCRAR